MSDSDTSRFQDNPIDIKLRLAALWTAIMFVYAYVDIFHTLRADYVQSVLEGKVVNTPFEVNQAFLIFAVAYILPATLMIYLSITLPARTNRKANIIVAGIYMVTIALACIGEEWIYFWLGSGIEIILLAMVIRMARRWPADERAERQALRTTAPQP